MSFQHRINLLAARIKRLEEALEEAGLLKSDDEPDEESEESESAEPKR